MKCNDLSGSARPLESPPSPRVASRRAGSVFRLLPLLLVACLWLAADASAQSVGASTHAEFEMTHRERIGGNEVIITNDNLPGQDDTDSITVVGNIVGTYGTQDVTVEAMVLPTDNGGVKLRAEGEHVFNLTGTSLQTDVWLEADSDILARATLVDELTISGVLGSEATVELYFQIRGMADAQIDIDPNGDLSYAMSTQARLEASTSAPHSGGGVHNTSLVFPGGYLPRDLVEQRFVDDYVVLTLSVDPSEPVPLEISFEIEPMTNLRNFVEIGTLNADGLHRPSFWDNAAELLGVVVLDDQGTSVPDAIISGQAGYDYPVTEDPPSPFPPANVILSPVAISDSDLGEYDASQVPFEQMFDQSGLTVNFTSGQTGFDVHFSDPNALRSSANFVNNWQSEVSFTLPLQGYVDFDLGGSYPIDRMALWNVSLEDITVLVSDSPSGPWTQVGQYTGLQSHINWFSYNADILDFGAQYTARYVRIQVDSAHLLDPGFTYAIVGEVAVSAIPVPEPGSLLMAGWGMAGVSFLARLRRRSTSSGLGERDPA